MTDRPTPWFPSANQVQGECDGNDSSDVVALIAQADVLLSALTDEIERARDLRVGYWWLRRRHHPQANGTR